MSQILQTERPCDLDFDFSKLLLSSIIRDNLRKLCQPLKHLGKQNTYLYI